MRKINHPFLPSSAIRRAYQGQINSLILTQVITTKTPTSLMG